jgi:uncharacterized protein (TIGR02145 family)
MKIVFWIFVILFGIILALLTTLGIWAQYDFEKYLNKQIDEYGILKNRKRLNYQPLVFFAINNLNKKKVSNSYDAAFSDIYTAKNSSKPNSLEHGISSLPFWDVYMFYCYYSNVEIDSIIQKGNRAKKQQVSFKIKIGDQIWSNKNLNVFTFSNGDSILEAKTAEDWMKAVREEKPAWCYYNNDSTNGKIYGKLYNWYAVHDERGLAPVNWRVPNETDWEILTDYFGGKNVAGSKLNKKNVINKYCPNAGNVIMFSALHSGYRSGTNGKFHCINESGFWWTSTVHSDAGAKDYSLSIITNKLEPNTHYKSYGFSVRAVANIID